MDPISSLFVAKIATFVEQSSKVLDVKIAMIGTGGLVGWWYGGNSKITAHILFLSITVQMDKLKCKHFKSVPPLQLLWFVGNMCLGLVKYASQAKHLVLLILVGESRGGQQRDNIDCVLLK